jgi:UDP-glucose 4-epimerase
LFGEYIGSSQYSVLEFTMTRLVVTGATGFIGTRFIDAAIARGYEVIALSRNASAVTQKSRPGLQVKRWQFGEALPELRGAAALISLAAFIPQDLNDAHHAAACFDINAVGAMEVASQAADQGIPKIVHISSGQIYAPTEKPATEQSPVYPTQHATYYLASKFAGELCVQAVARRKKQDAVILRLASTYGPGMHARGMIPNCIRRLSAGETVTITEGGSYHVDFIYIDDVVQMALKALAPEVSGIFNVGSGVASTFLQVAQAVANTLGASRDLIKVEGEPKEIGFAALDITKAEKVLGFKPRQLEEGLAEWLKGDQASSLTR